MSLLKLYAKKVDTIIHYTGYAVSWLTTMLVIVVCYDVFSRYFLKKSVVAFHELQWHIFSVIFLIGAAYTWKDDKHVRIDYLYARFPLKVKAWINMLGSVVFLVPFSIFIIVTSYDFVRNSFVIGETSPDPGGLPARYIIKGFIPIGFFLLLLQSTSTIVHSLAVIMNKSVSKSVSENSEPTAKAVEAVKISANSR